ncbi:sensor histidine kinase [Rathayibacter sp. CAU 1779]
MPAPTRPLRARDIVVDVLVFVVVCLASFVPAGRGDVAQDSVTQHGLLVLPYMAVAGLVLFARRRLPVVALVCCALIAMVAPLLGAPHSAGLTVPVAIAMYSVARYSSRALTVGFAVALIVLLPLEALLIAGTGFGAGDVTEPATLQPAVLVAFAAALGSAIRSYFDALESARERARRAEESREAEARRRVAEDRLAIARDLHDSVAHRIAVINLQAGVAARALRSDPDEAEAAVAIVGDAARNVLTELNDMLGLLRSSADRDIVDEPDFERVEGLLALFARSGLRVKVHVAGDPYPLDARVGPIAYRVVQEALTNAYKHGRDRTAELELTYSDDGLTIRVTNPVTDAAATASASSSGTASTGHGLVGMRERLSEVGGTLTLDRTGTGFELTAMLPGSPTGAMDAVATVDDTILDEDARERDEGVRHDPGADR